MKDSSGFLDNFYWNEDNFLNTLVQKFQILKSEFQNQKLVQSVLLYLPYTV